jgi:hypothetical protein
MISGDRIDAIFGPELPQRRDIPPSDADIAIARDWLQAIESVIREEGVERAAGDGAEC